MIVVAQATACRLGVLTMLVCAEEADDGVDDGTARTDYWEKQPGGEVA